MSEPIKRYWAYPASHYEDSADGPLVLHTDHLAALESARAEAFRMGQESMKKDAAVVAGKSPCAGHATREDRYGCETCGYHDQIAELIMKLPLKDKP